MIDVLKKRCDFLRASRRGRSHAFKDIVIQIYERRDFDGRPRFGFTASKKLGDAPRRSFVKRRLRHALRESLSGVDFIGCDCVLIGRYNTHSSGFLHLKNHIESALQMYSRESISGSIA